MHNTVYPLLSTTKNVRVLTLALKQVNDEAAAKTIKAGLVWDGITTAYGGQSAVNNTTYYLTTSPLVDYLGSGATFLLFGQYVAREGRSLGINIRNESAAGTNQHLYGYVRYAVLEQVRQP